MNIAKFISECERSYDAVLEKVAFEVRNSGKIIFILITGASCAGKTTTTKKLRRCFAKVGIHAETVSLDDFYRDRTETPLGKDGKPDLETIESLDLPLLNKTLAELAAGREVRIPRFDFVTQKRSSEYEALTLDPGEVVIIEGLHALNPRICEELSAQDSVYRVYLYAENGVYDVKLLRRLVRDSYYRHADAALTLSMWDTVLDGEKRYIRPYADTADIRINTFFSYETSVLAERGLELLSTVKQGDPFYAQAESLKEEIMKAGRIGYNLVPEGSLMWEFIKK